MEPGRIADLMQGEIDGVNTPAEQAELQRLLAADPAARAGLAQMRETASWLAAAAAEDQDPPAGLRGRIMADVRARAGAARLGGRGRPRAGARLGYALAGALGLAAGVLLLVALGWEAQPGAPRDRALLRGTIGPWAPASAALGPAEPIDVAGLAGTLRAGRHGRWLELDLELATAERGELRLVWPGEAALAGIAATDGGAGDGLPRGLRTAPGQVAFATGPRVRCRLLLQGATAAALPLRILYEADGRVRGEQVLGER